MKGIKPTSDDFSSEEERQNFSLNLKEGLSPEGVYDDWGDFDCDNRNESRTDLYCSDIDEVEEYYDQLRPANIKIL
ncbi:MAG TPA: hypothetical protein V6D07_09760 [Trichocoleus sp.]